MSQEVDIALRMSYLNSSGVYCVASELYARVHRLIKEWHTKARKNPIVAAAQRRLLLPNVEEAAVTALLSWIYQTPMVSQNAAEMYAVWSLSSDLGVIALAEKSLDQLINDFSGVVQHIEENGVPLHTLVGSGGLDDTNVIEVILDKVFKDESPAPRLLELVLRTLADHLNSELWAIIKDPIGHTKALGLIDTLIDRRFVRPEQHTVASVKPESDVGGTDLSHPVEQDERQTPEDVHSMQSTHEQSQFEFKGNHHSTIKGLATDHNGV